MDKKKADKLISRYERKIFGFALSHFSSLAQAEELAADIVCEVYASFLKTDDIVNTDGYVYRIAKNVYAQHIRRMKNENYISIEEIVSPLPSPEEESDGGESERLRGEIALLTERQRTIIYMHYYEKLSVKEISEKLGISAGTVKWHLSDARKSIREGLEMTEYVNEDLELNPIKFISAGINGIGGPYCDTGDVFDTRLKANIAWSCYHTPKTAEEISRALGVPRVYIADDIKKLEDYGFIDRLDNTKNPKYRTNMYIIDAREEWDSTEHDLRKKAAEMLCDKFYPQVFKAFDESEDCFGFTCGNDRNFMKYNIVMLLTKFMMPAEMYGDMWKYAVKRPDGGHFIAHATVWDDCRAMPEGKDIYGANGYMHCGNGEYQSIQIGCRYTDGWRNYKDYTDKEWEALAEYIRNGCDKNSIAPENYKLICDKGYVIDDEIKVMYTKTDGENALMDKLREPLRKFTVPEAAAEFSAKLEEAIYQAASPHFPKHIRPIVREYSKGNLGTAQQIVYVVEEMLKRGMLLPLTDEQKRSVFSVLALRR